MAGAIARRFVEAGDRLLGLLLPTVDAGACVPEHGQFCGCTPSGYRKIVACSGSCTATSVRCS